MATQVDNALDAILSCSHACGEERRSKKRKVKVEGVGLACTTQRKPAPLAGHIETHRSVHRVAQERHLNGTRGGALRVQIRPTGHHKRPRIHIVRHVAHAAHTKVHGNVQFRTTLPGHAKHHRARLHGERVSLVHEHLFGQDVQMVTRPRCGAHTGTVVVGHPHRVALRHLWTAAQFPCRESLGLHLYRAPKERDKEKDGTPK